MPTPRRTLLALAALLLAAPAAAHAQGAQAQGAQARAPELRRWSDRVAPDAADDFDPARLARIDAWLQRLVAERRIPGAVAMVVRDGRVAYHKAFGVRDVERGLPLRTDDVFRIASQSKALTSLAVMILWEEGRIGLDDPIEKYLPAFAKPTVLTKFNAADSTFEAQPAKRRITVRRLLTHTSGLDYADIGSDEFKAIYAKAGLSAIGREGDVLGPKIDALGRLPLRHEPGEKFTYGLSIDVLGRLVEVVSGMPLDRFLRTRVFEPLDMRDTYFELPAEKRARLVALHTVKDGKLVPMREREGAIHPEFPARPVSYFSGGGGLSGTTRDYARFLQLFLNGGELDGVRLLSRKTVELMLTNQIAPLDPAFGLGFALETPANDWRRPRSLGSFSWSGAFNTWYWADPKERMVCLIYANTWNVDGDVATPFETLVYSALK